MFGKTTNTESKPNRIDSLIGPGTVIEGDITFTGGLRVEGEVKGDISVASTGTGILMLGGDGVVTGNIRVSHLVVDGTINGSVYVLDSVELRPTAKVMGDINYGTLEMQLGAVIHGHLVHIDPNAKP